MAYGESVLKRGAQGPDVVELQIRLAGFRGTLPDGDFGPNTERQVINFQRDYMKVQRPTGIADGETLRAIDKFADEYYIDFEHLKCPCRRCGGFGQGKFRDEYRPGLTREEKHYLYEYPGMHRLLLWAVRAAFFYMPEHKFTINSGYRCSIDNAKQGRTTTNHQGKAIDLDIILEPGERNVDDRRKCDGARGRLVATADAQVGWGAPNRKALEPAEIAPTWVHYDVRSYERKFLGDEVFCTTLKELDNRKPIKI